MAFREFRDNQSKMAARNSAPQQERPRATTEKLFRKEAIDEEASKGNGVTV
jgi:hypothetical protein